jgi:ABC-type iron transport system FetAB permease component
MFVPEPELKNNIGWSLVFFTCMNVIVNMGIILVNGFKSIRLIIKRIVKKIRNKRSKKFQIDQDMTFENYHL